MKTKSIPFFQGPVVPLRQDNHITVETYMYVQQEKTINNQFFIYGPECEINDFFLAIWGRPVGAFNYQTGPILLFGYIFIYIYVHVK